VGRQDPWPGLDATRALDFQIVSGADDGLQAYDIGVVLDPGEVVGQ
jgi:hypothetical protein